jgi:hypothetical protein
MHRSLHLVEHEDRRPPVMVDGFFIVWLQSYFKHAKLPIFEEDFVMFWRCNYGIQCRIPSSWIQFRRIFCIHEALPSLRVEANYA